MERGAVIVSVTALSLAVSFFLSGMEAGVFALSRLRVRQLMRAGKARARILHGYLEQPENFLWTILVGNTLANFITVTLLVTMLHRWLEHHPGLFLAGFLAAAFLFYATCDLLPKILFRTYPNRLCMALVQPFRLIHATLSPLVTLLNWLSRGLLRWTGGRTFTGRLFGSREELRLVMQESAQAFTSEERAMINRVLDLQKATTEQIAIPLEKTVTVAAGATMSEAIRLCRERQLSRLPVWRVEDGRRRVIGVVSLKTVLYQADLDLSKSVSDYVKPALYLSEEMRLEEVLRRMQRSGRRLAIVLGRNQRELGIVSLQDVLKFIFGAVSL